MSTPGTDVLTKVSTEAAETFVTSYYPALSSARSSLSSYYHPATPLPDNKSIPAITFNGNVIPSALDFQTLFEKQMPNARYEVQCYDCHPLNVDYPSAKPTGNTAASGKNMSIILSVSGYVRYGEGKDLPMRAFSDSFVLVPGEEGEKKKARDRGGKGGGKDWVIQSQTFRLTV